MNLSNILHFEFSLLFTVYLLTVFFISKLHSKSFKHSKIYFTIQYFAVVIHELAHFIWALICLHWPKFNPIKIVEKNWKYQISGSVSVKTYSYKNLFYNILQKEKIVNLILLIWQIIWAFVIWLAPVILVLLISYWLFWGLNIWEINLATFDLKYLFLIPVYFFLAQVSNLSWADIKNALPGIFLLIFIPLNKEQINFLISNIELMWGVLFLSWVIYLVKKILWK